MIHANVKALFRILLVVCSVNLLAQVQTGTPQFGSFGGGPVDVVNLANLNTHYAFPIISKPGRSTPFNYALAYDSSVWYPTGVVGSQSWAPVPFWGWTSQTVALTGYVTSTKGKTVYCFGDGGRVPYQMQMLTSYVDPFGIRHQIAVDMSRNPCFDQDDDTEIISDGSGYTVTGHRYTGKVTVKTRDGATLVPVINSQSGVASYTDRNGNRITTTGSVFTDTLNTTALSISGSGTDQSPLIFSYTAPNGSPASYTMHYTSRIVRTNFGCSGIVEYGPTTTPLPSDITLPDGSQYTFTYESTPGYQDSVTGRIASVTLPTGGSVQYSYTGGNQGISCSDGSTSGLTRTTPDGTWTYTRPATGSTVVTDPKGNQTALSFRGIYETQRQVYQGSIGGTPLQTTTTCYNGNYANCTTTAITLPIIHRTVFVQVGTKQSRVDNYYTNRGLQTQSYEYNFGNGTPGSLLRRTVIVYNNSLGSIVDRPASVTVYDGSGNVKAQTTYGYDEYGLTGTGVPQHVAVSGSRGNLTSIHRLAGSITLNQSFTYFDTGVLNTQTDVNAAQTTYVYGASSCNGAFPTQVNTPLGLSRSYSWDCNGAVQTSATDENGYTTTSSYDSLWRPNTVTDAAGNNTQYGYTANTAQSSLLFNSGNSIISNVVTLDGLGRAKLSQMQQGPGSGSYSSTQVQYDSAGLAFRTTVPYNGGLSQEAASGTAYESTTTFDALGRATLVVGGGGSVNSLDYQHNDVLRTVGPAPSGENSKQKQFEYDGLGRLTSVCEVTALPGSGTCGQTVARTGYWTRYTYDTLGNITNVVQNAQSGTQQARTFAFDSIGRLLSETNPETGQSGPGTTQYAYDSDPSGTCAGTYNGDLVKKVDPMGNVTCYSYDALHRVLSARVVSGAYASSTPQKRFVYDTATVNGTTMSNARGRLAAAYTCTGDCSSKITDLGFSYAIDSSLKGTAVTVYQSSPNSGGYYQLTGTYWPNGVLGKLSTNLKLGNGTSLPVINYGVDGAGRLHSVAGSQNLLQSTTYNIVQQVTGLTLGSGDSEAFTYDAASSRMTQFRFNYGVSVMQGNYGWNADGSLSTLGITDSGNSAHNQSCQYGSDDLGRIARAYCGSKLDQSFSFDPFGNIYKSANVGFSFLPGSYGSSTNHIVDGGMNPTYDGNGNLTGINADGTHAYGWNADGNAVSVDGASATYDALGRMVESYAGGTYTQYVYGPDGSKLASMHGQTIAKAFVALPAGAKAVYDSNGFAYYRHPDVLESSRLATTWDRQQRSYGAYAPYGEPYDESGTADRSFTGQEQNTSSTHYDFMFRKYHPVSSRWVSPDPAGLAAVDPTEPQSWNRYAYLSNAPLDKLDLLGLFENRPIRVWLGTIDIGFFRGPRPRQVISEMGGKKLIGGLGRHVTVAPANNEEITSKETDCVYRALGAGAFAAAADFVGLPVNSGNFGPSFPGMSLNGSGGVQVTLADVALLMKEPNVERAIFGLAIKMLPSITAQVATKAIPIIGWGLTAYQATSATITGVRAYKQTYDGCMSRP